MAAPTNQEILESSRQALKDLMDAGGPASVTVSTGGGNYTYTNQSISELQKLIDKYEAKVAVENTTGARTYVSFEKRPL